MRGQLLQPVEGVGILVEDDRWRRAPEDALVTGVPGGGQTVDLVARVIVDKP